jgi:hypothetical protein
MATNNRERVDIRTQPEEVEMLQLLDKYLRPKIGKQSISTLYRTCLLKYGRQWIEAEYGKPFEEVIKFKTSSSRIHSL